MNPRSQRVVFTIGLFALIVTLLMVLSLGVGAASQNKNKTDGLDGEIKTEVVETEPYDEDKYYGPPQKPTSCTVKTFYTRRVLGINSPLPGDKFIRCAVEIKPGTWLVKSGAYAYIKQADLPIAGKITGVDKYYRTISGEDLIFERGIVDGRTVIKITDDFTKQLTPKFSFATGQLTYSYDETNGYIPLDTEGRTLNWGTKNTSRFSPRDVVGKYIVLDFVDGSLVRIDRETRETLQYGAGSAYRNSAKVSLTVDGKYSARTRGGEAFIYDLDKCEKPVSTRTKRHRAYWSADCDFLDLSRYLQQNFEINYSALVIDLDFDSSKQLRVWFRDSSPASLVREVRIALGGSEFSDNNGYIALGDSYASGEGDMDDSWYEFGTNVSENKCHLSRRSYPYLLADQLDIKEFHSVACSGAVMSDVTDNSQMDSLFAQLAVDKYGKWTPGAFNQTRYIDAVSLTAITISIGGNDVGFAGKLQECVLGPGTCKYAEEGVYRSYVAMEITNLYDELLKTYQELIKTTDKKTKIYVLGYPRFVKQTGGSCGLNVNLNDSERYFIGETISYMNQVIRSAANEVGGYYLDVEDAMYGANLCSDVSDDDMAINGLTFGDDIKLPNWLSVTGPVVASLTQLGIGAESYHPNQNGHQLYKDKILELTNSDLLGFGVCLGGESVCPAGSRNVPTPDATYWGDEAYEYAQSYQLDGSQNLPTVPRSVAMVVFDSIKTAARQFSINLSGLKPSSQVNFVLNSEPIDLGTFVADENGQLSVELLLPNGVEPGIHTLNAYGENLIGQEFNYYEQVAVMDSSSVKGDCVFVTEAGIDKDNDGIDDVCDSGYVSVHLSPEINDSEEDEVVKDVTASTTPSISSETLATNPTPAPTEASINVSLTSFIANYYVTNAATEEEGKQMQKTIEYATGNFGQTLGSTAQRESSLTKNMVIGVIAVVVLAVGLGVGSRYISQKKGSN